MRVYQKLGIMFYAYKSNPEKDVSALYVRITLNGKRVALSLKRMIKDSDWDPDTGYVKGKSKEAKEHNKYIDLVKSKLYNHYSELQLQQKEISARKLKFMFLGIEEGGKTLLELSKYHNVQMQLILTPGTLKNYYTTEKYLRLFIENFLLKEDIELNKMSYQFIIDFEHFLRTNSLHKHKILHNNGVMKHIERVKKLMNFAEKLEWITKNPFNKFQLKFKKFDKVFLNQNELEKLEKHHFTKEYLKTTRDIFVFSCYTGLSYVDLKSLKKININKGINGRDWIFTKRTKSNQPVKIPLLSKAMEIIKLYDNEVTEVLLPVYSNQKLNIYLKEVCAIAGIYKPITFHSARHTFATTVTLSNGVPIETVSKLLGHTKLSTTQIYARVLQSKIGHDIDDLEIKLKNNY